MVEPLAWTLVTGFSTHNTPRCIPSSSAPSSIITNRDIVRAGSKYRSASCKTMRPPRGKDTGVRYFAWVFAAGMLAFVQLIGATYTVDLQSTGDLPVARFAAQCAHELTELPARLDQNRGRLNHERHDVILRRGQTGKDTWAPARPILL